eukprot:gene1566-2200_t
MKNWAACLIYVALLCCASSSSIPAGDEEQVTQGSLEMRLNSRTDWASSSGCVVISSGDRAWGGLRSEDGSDYFGLQGPGAYVMQTVTGLVPARTYWVSVALAARPGQGDASVGLYLDDALQWSVAPSASAFSVQGPIAFTSTGPTMTIQLANDSPAGEPAVLLDFVAVSASQRRFEEEVKIPRFEEEVKIPRFEEEVKIPGFEEEVKILGFEEEVKIPGFGEEVKIPGFEEEKYAPRLQEEGVTYYER